MYRNKKNSNLYISRNADGGCALCALHQFEILEESNHTAIVKNNYPYDVWEGMDVIEHLMILPKEHAAALSDVSPATLQNIIQLIVKYESLGYNVYARTRESKLRSISHHQHTHLLKVAGKPAKALLYVQKPYLLLKI